MGDTVTRTVTASTIGYVRGTGQDGRPLFGNARAGETVELSAEEADRLEGLGAVADPDAEPAAEDVDPADLELTDEELAALGVDGTVDHLASLALLAGTVNGDGGEADVEARDRFVAELDRVDALEAERVDAEGAPKPRKGVTDAVAGYRMALEA